MSGIAAQRRQAKKCKPSAQPRTPKKRTKPGPKPSITLAVVKRVSIRVGIGLTLKLALAAENCATVNEETWKKALAAHPEFSPHYEAAKGKFLELSMVRLAKAEDLKYLCWLLERRHSDLFAKPEAAPIVNVNQSVAVGIPSDVIERARELAGSDQKPPTKPHG